MATKRRFCTNCGGQVFDNSKFCGICGSSLADDGSPAVVSPTVQAAPPPYSPPPAYRPPPPAYVPPPPVYQQPPVYNPPPQPYGYPPQGGGMPGEALTGIIPGASRKKSLISVEGFNIIVTNQRMIFALMTNQMVQEEARRNASGKGFFGGMAAGITAGYDLWKRYLQMPPEQALRENPGNFDIHLNQIRRVKFEGGKTLFKKGGVSIGMNVNRDADEPAKLEIETVGVKHKFEIATHFQGEARDVLRRAGLIT